MDKNIIVWASILNGSYICTRYTDYVSVASLLSRGERHCVVSFSLRREVVVLPATVYLTIKETIIIHALAGVILL